MITVMVDGGLAPFFLGPPRVGVMQTIWLPPPGTGDDGEQEPVPLLSNVGVGGLGLLIVKSDGTKIVNTTFGVGVVETLLTVHVIFPAWSVGVVFGVGFWTLPVIPTGAERLEVAGKGTVVIWLPFAFARAVPAESVPLTTTELRMAWF
jgi:hypothetical protein